VFASNGIKKLGQETGGWKKGPSPELTQKRRLWGSLDGGRFIISKKKKMGVTCHPGPKRHHKRLQKVVREYWGKKVKKKKKKSRERTGFRIRKKLL